MGVGVSMCIHVHILCTCMYIRDYLFDDYHSVTRDTGSALVTRFIPEMSSLFFLVSLNFGDVPILYSLGKTVYIHTEYVSSLWLKQTE